MRDPARHGPAKAMLAAMQAAGVDLEDGDAVDRFLAGYRLPSEGRLPELAPPEFPPVELPTLEELQVAAAATPTLRRLRALVEWVGQGRKLTPNGNLTVADGKELASVLGLVDPDRLASMRVGSSRDIAGLELVLGWAKEIRLARVHKGRLVPVKQHQRLLDDPLELTSQAVSALPSLDWAPLTDMIESSFPGGLAEALVDLLALLYAPEEPVSLEDLARHVWEEHVERHPGRGGAQPSPAVAAGHRRRDHPAPEPLAGSRHGGACARGGKRRRAGAYRGRRRPW
jgi:hypothetical protein